MITLKELEDRYGIPHIVMCAACARMSEVDEAAIRKPLHKVLGEIIEENEGRIETLQGLMHDSERQLEILRKAKAQMEQEGI